MDAVRDVFRENAEFLRDQELKLSARLAVLPKGKIREKRIGSGVYYYLSYRKGRTVRTDYFGTSALSGLREELKERERLVQELRRVRSGLKQMRVGRSDVADIVEPLRDILRIMTDERKWDAGVEIIGSWCFLLYQKTLPIGKFPFKTDDLDILVPRPFKGREFDFGESLIRLGFSLRFHPDGSQYFVGLGMKIEFLTREGRKTSALRSFAPLGIVAQRLRYLEILFRDPIVLKVSPGIRVKVPAPASFLLHKLIIASLPARVRKREKDVRQAVAVVRFVLFELAEREKLGRLWKELPSGWKVRALRTLRGAAAIVPLEEGSIRRLREFLSEA